MPPIFHWLRGKKIPYLPCCPSRQVCGTMKFRLARLLLQPLWGSQAFYKPLRYVNIGLPRPQKTIADFEAIHEGKQAIPEYFNFASDVLDMWTQMEKVSMAVLFCKAKTLFCVIRKFMGLTYSDIFWNTSDTGWVKAAWSLYSTWLTGACVFVHELPKTDTSLILNTLCQMPITVFCCVPTMFQMIVQQDLTRYKFKSLRHCVAGGESLNPDVRKKWRSQTGVELYEGYGQSETALICGNQVGKEIKSGSMGKAFPPYDVQIVDDEGNILPPGKEGSIGIRIKPKPPICFFTGYLNNAEKTASCKRGDFYLTGDCAYMDEDGYFWFKGRTDDVINSSSYRIGPFEVESALSEHPAVVESAAVSSPDPIRGEVVKAFVVLNSNFINQDPVELTRELQNHVKKLTAPYKYPRKVEFVQELPKTVSGKIQRSVLRKKEWGN
ncbi:acyl-coenzyme A synthetase ACSM5, mitochondrial-like [Gracilinanus agilis]|uniref:acyl-coenzyme A synthetase ACSM5, mitochondrial-like n=1 Tax=Gracilinanus agilis TaxID=191870 RepID=UPI001CFE7031|nr:acyl-coenzyme A synthetase ACSM5, mitochondrial-like [Gracilinanus agilis]